MSCKCFFAGICPLVSSQRYFEASPFLQRIRCSSVLKFEIMVSQNSSPLSKPVLSYPFLEKIVLFSCEFQNMTNVTL